MNALQSIQSINEIASNLVSATHLVEPEILAQTHLVAKRYNIPFGRVMVMNGYIAEGDLNSLLLAASLVRKGELSFERASECLTFAITECLPFTYALEQHDVLNGKLARLLTRAQIISESAIIPVVNEVIAEKTTLGEKLVQHQLLTITELASTIEALTLIRGKCISEEIAALAIRSVHAWKCSFPEALAQFGVALDTVTPRLGELLLGAGVLAENQVLKAAEVGVETDIPIGEVLFKLGLIPPVLLKAALRLQSMVLSGKLNQFQAQELLSQAHQHRVPVEKVLNEFAELKKDLLKLLLSAELIDEDKLKQAVSISPVVVEPIASSISFCKLLEMPTLRAAVKCAMLVRQKSITYQQATHITRHCHLTNVSVDQALSELCFLKANFDGERTMRIAV